MSRKSTFLIPLLIMPLLWVILGADPGRVKEATVTSADGVEIHYLTAGSGEPALVFVHGWCCDASYWQAQLEHFSRTHRVVCVDLGGHGESGLGREDWTMAAFGADVEAVVEKEGLDRVVLVGHSMGGAVIAEAALLMPDRVCGLVGVDNFQKTALNLTDEQISAYTGMLSADFPTNTAAWVRQMFLADSDSALVQGISSDMASAPPAVGISALGNLLHWYSSRPVEVLPLLPAPLRCINSDRSPSDEKGLKAVRPDYELRLMHGGHFLAQEHPAEFDSLLEETLAGFPCSQP